MNKRPAVIIKSSNSRKIITDKYPQPQLMVQGISSNKNLLSPNYSGIMKDKPEFNKKQVTKHLQRVRCKLTKIKQNLQQIKSQQAQLIAEVSQIADIKSQVSKQILHIGDLHHLMTFQSNQFKEQIDCLKIQVAIAAMDVKE